ncbi:MAG: ATP synthase F1 subunit delta [Armatimonadetes bacterium]|nr:ATP synthase F1 subunit delta [Armatimonadota bacterium]
MIDRSIVRRYATALFNAAQAADVVDLVESDLGLIAYTLETVSRLQEAMVSPLIPAKTKREIVTSIFHGKIHEITLFYLYLLIDKDREEVIRQTEEEYIQLANGARGIVVADVTAAVEMTDDEVLRLKARLSEYTGKRVEIKLQVNPSIIGGIIVRIGDTVMDGSVTGHLRRMREEFLGH